MTVEVYTRDQKRVLDALLRLAGSSDVLFHAFDGGPETLDELLANIVLLRRQRKEGEK